MVSNKSAGSAFERELAQVLSSHGFWVHRLQDNKNGQPADLIVAFNGSTYLIDCKDCISGTFSLSRIEPNQHSAMQLWHDTGNGSGLFAIRYGNGNVYLIRYQDLEDLIGQGLKGLREEKCSTVGRDLEWWMKAATEAGEDDCDWMW